MNDRKALKQLVEIFGVPENDLPKTIRRFKDEVAEMEKLLKKK